MDNELKAKVEELLKNKDVEKLSKDDLDNISGGVTKAGPEKGTVYIDGKLYTEYELNTLFMETARQFGYWPAVDAFCAFTGYTCKEMSKTYVWNGDKSDTDMMEIVLYRFWMNYCGESKA